MPLKGGGISVLSFCLNVLCEYKPGTVALVVTKAIAAAGRSHLSIICSKIWPYLLYFPNLYI